MWVSDATQAEVLKLMNTGPSIHVSPHHSPMTTMRLPLSTRRSVLGNTALAATAYLFPAEQRLFGAGSVTTVGPIRSAMDRAAKCCLAWLDPKQNHLPTRGYEVAHDTGRWWDAMLRYEAATGVRIPEQAESAMMQNLRALTNNPAALLTNTADLSIAVEKIKVNPHNLRESMLAYTALVRHRNSEWAREQGQKLVAAIAGNLDTDGQLNFGALTALVGGGRPLTNDPLMIARAPTGKWFNATGNTGRAIEAIVWFHEATGDKAAMELARRLAEVHLRNIIDLSGKVRGELLDPNQVGHTHSYLGTLRGLLLYGLASGEKQYVEAVANTYRKGLWGTTISYSGWTPHDQGKIRFPNKQGDPLGEHASCGDVAQIALWLAQRAGQTDLLDDVERLTRARLLPSQLVAPADSRRDGAWGVYPDPFGYGAILDVFAAVLHSLVDIDQHIITRPDDDTAVVNLHFDADTPALSVRSERNARAALHITPKSPLKLLVRVPSWTPRDTVRLSVNETRLPLQWQGPFVVIEKSEITKSDAIALHYELPERDTREEMPISHTLYRLHWRGDAVIGCEPKVAIYPAK